MGFFNEFLTPSKQNQSKNFNKTAKPLKDPMDSINWGLAYDTMADHALGLYQHIFDLLRTRPEVQAFNKAIEQGLPGSHTDEERHTLMHFSLLGSVIPSIHGLGTAYNAYKSGDRKKAIHILEHFGNAFPGASENTEFINDPETMVLVHQKLHQVYHELRTVAGSIKCSKPELFAMNQDNCDWEFPGIDKELLHRPCPVCHYFGEDDHLADRLVSGLNY